MAGLTNQLSGPQFEQLLADLRAISAEPTLDQIRAVMIRYGVKSPTSKDGTPSKMAAATLRDGPFARYVERLNAGRETREALCTAVGTGVHPLDAIEEAMVIELQDHLTQADGGVIDIKFVIDQLIKLRTSISMREDSHRKQADLERRLQESEKKIEVANKQLGLRDEQIAKLQREKSDWTQRRTDAEAALNKAVKKGGITADTRAMIERALKGELAA